ncbi:MAG TPA: ribbon-helix-helix domain-containing protein [Acidimicrobiales bacterium]|jgi:Arc/MetJ-type ribon-helix-helix transcriptional regulator|nr:ribbon-helix-helix domain-containing protein [Acidimicrobiales bacterium]
MTIQIAVKLDDEAVAKLDQLVAEGAYASRSQAVRRAVDTLVRSEERWRIDQGFAEGFARQPETDGEMAEATRLAIESIHEEPWEVWW